MHAAVLASHAPMVARQTCERLFQMTEMHHNGMIDAFIPQLRELIDETGIHVICEICDVLPATRRQFLCSAHDEAMQESNNIVFDHLMEGWTRWSVDD